MDVSIIIPVYNDETTIVRAIESVLSQISNDDELIVVINGSTDKSEVLIQRYAVDTRVKIEHSASGRSRARNKGLLLASGRFIGFLDADDMMMQGHVERAKKFLISNNDYYAYTDKVLTIKGNEKYISTLYTGEMNSLLLKQRNIFEVGAVMFRNKHVIPFIDELDYNEDYVFWIENLMGKKVYFDNTFVGVHRFFDGNNTMITHRNDMIATQIIVAAVLKEKKVLSHSLNVIKILKKILRFLTTESSKEPVLYELVNKQFFPVMTIARIILKTPIINKVVIHHYEW